MSHTPGPWWVEDSDHPMGEGREVYDGFGRTASVYGDTLTAEANARLIAAAPELLAALREVADGCARRLRKGKDQGDLDTLRLCRTAIAKAEGRE
jgi:hypothetical protein